ncbi:MAG TPA: glycosyltransferase [Candidatus Acidoferrales bacterium]|nr:glycosyltransferase [Candidatus Acidoferrales bacterium]
MTPRSVSFVFLSLAAVPFVYYLIVLISAWRFFRQQRVRHGSTPPVSILKPIRGLDPGAYENFASLCRQDYPEYELLLCVGQNDDRVLPVIEKLVRDFPERSIRVFVGANSSAPNDKVAKLVRLVAEANYEVLVMGDSDVRVQPDYLRTVVAPLADPAVGAVTCFYMPADRHTLAEKLQAIGMVSDFYAGVLVAWQLEGVKFALGPTIATTRTRLAELGGLQTIENRPGDDLLVGRLIAEHGHKVELVPYTVQKLAGYHSMRELLDKRLRWIVVMRHMRPWGHLGLLLTQGLPWSLAAIAVHPTARIALAYLGTYLVLRAAMTWSIGVLGLKQSRTWKEMLLIPAWDLFAFSIWLASFVRSTVRWRDRQYRIRNGMLIPVNSASAEE